MIENIFSQVLLKWFDQYGRKNLPWQQPKDPYRIWVSEIMLQQTQVKTVIPYFERFIKEFPNVHALAAASSDKVMSLWSGLGYYSRAKNLHNAAISIVKEYNGLLPQDLHTWLLLPGIGKTTAAAICSQAYNHSCPILDANVKRVLSRIFMIHGASLERQLWDKAQQCMPQIRCADYTQAIMDFGALLCTNKNPSCSECPFNQACLAYKDNQTHNYPLKKKKKIKPTKELNFYYIQDKTSVLLIKNPSKGIWANLWVLPFGPKDNHDIIDTLMLSKKKEHQPKYQQTIKHSFSHYHLLMHIWSLQSSAKVSVDLGKWLYPEDTLKVGIAKPIHDVIHQKIEPIEIGLQ